MEKVSPTRGLSDATPELIKYNITRSCREIARFKMKVPSSCKFEVSLILKTYFLGKKAEATNFVYKSSISNAKSIQINPQILPLKRNDRCRSIIGKFVGRQADGGAGGGIFTSGKINSVPSDAPMKEGPGRVKYASGQFDASWFIFKAGTKIADAT